MKTFRVTLTDTKNVTREFITRGWTIEHARLNTFETYGMAVRIRSVVFLDY